MKLSLATSALGCFLNDPINPMHHSDTIPAIRSCGFSCMDYGIPAYQLEDNWQAEADDLRNRLMHHGMNASQAHAPFMSMDPRSEEYMKYLRKALLFCRRAGMPMMVVHPVAVKGNGREAFFELNTAYYRALISAAEETSVQVLIENIGNYADPFYLWNGSDLRELVDRVGHPLFNACWDVGHANHYYHKHCDQYDSIVALGDKLKAIHVHDNCGYFADEYRHYRIDMHTMPFMSPYACVNYDAVMQGLSDAGYNGTFNFETDAPQRNPHKAPFVYQGKTVCKLDRVPMEIWQHMNKGLYAIGKYMLETYGVYEEEWG